MSISHCLESHIRTSSPVLLVSLATFCRLCGLKMVVQSRDLGNMKLWLKPYHRYSIKLRSQFQKTSIRWRSSIFHELSCFITTWRWRIVLNPFWIPHFVVPPWPRTSLRWAPPWLPSRGLWRCSCWRIRCSTHCAWMRWPTMQRCTAAPLAMTRRCQEKDSETHGF